MDLAYAAFTEACVFGLDDAGICREILPKAGGSREMITLAMRCIGAQYVASLDASMEGMLSQLPKKGTRLLFARTEPSGRIVLVRSGPVQRFETLFGDDLAASSELPTERFPSLLDTDDEETALGTSAWVDEAHDVARSVEDQTEQFARTRRPSQGGLEVEAVTRRAPSTMRGFPPPPS